MKTFNWLLISLAIGLLTTACGDDAKSDEPTMDAEVVDPGPTTTQDAGPTTFECGATTCDVPTPDLSGLPEQIQAIVAAMPELVAGFLMIEGCCVEGGENVCGVMTEMGCVEQDMPGEPDEACPAISVDVMGMAIELAGCCKPTNQCGFNFGVLGLGCVEREEAAMSMTMGMSLPDAGSIMSIACGDSGGDAGADAGQ